MNKILQINKKIYVLYKVNKLKIEQLIQDCNNKKDTNWYANAFTVLINYYYNLLEKHGNNVNIQQINTMGQALNCIICDIKLIPSDMDVDNILMLQRTVVNLR